MKAICRTTGSEVRTCPCYRCNPNKQMEYRHHGKSKHGSSTQGQSHIATGNGGNVRKISTHP